MGDLPEYLNLNDLEEYGWTKSLTKDQVKYLGTQSLRDWGIENKKAWGGKDDSRYDKYDVGGNALLYVNANDPPKLIPVCMAKINLATKHYPGQVQPTFILPGAESKYDFSWESRSGDSRDSTAAGTANSETRELKLYDNKHLDKNVIEHELGHFVHYHLMNKFNESPLEDWEKEDIYDLRYLSKDGMDVYNQILDALDDRILEDGETREDFVKKWYNNEITFGGRLYNTNNTELKNEIYSDKYHASKDDVVMAMERRIRDGKPLEITELEVSKWDRIRKDVNEYRKNQDKWHNWKKIYEEEPWETNEYGNQNPQEMFAEFYARVHSDIDGIKDKIQTLDMIENDEEFSKIIKMQEEMSGKPYTIGKLDALRYSQAFDFYEKHKKKFAYFKKNLPNMSKKLIDNHNKLREAMKRNKKYMPGKFKHIVEGY